MYRAKAIWGIILDSENTLRMAGRFHGADMRFAELDPQSFHLSRTIAINRLGNRHFPYVGKGLKRLDVPAFRQATSRLALDPGECVMVGDDVEADMMPSRELGMRAIWSTEFLDPSSIAAGDRRWDGPKVKSLTELVGALGALDE
jgi:hypothetical protein